MSGCEQSRTSRAPVDGAEAEPVAYMHPIGAIWRLDNCPAGIDFSKDGWIPLGVLPTPSTHPAPASPDAEMVRPIVGIENRTAQEVFDIMSDRIRLRFSKHGGDR